MFTVWLIAGAITSWNTCTFASSGTGSSAGHVVSPGGLMGIWTRALDLVGRGGAATPAEPKPVGPQP